MNEDLTIFVLASFGLSNALAFLHIGLPFRILVSGLSDKQFYLRIKYDRLRGVRQTVLGRACRCHACIGFWIGAILSLGWAAQFDYALVGNVSVRIAQLVLGGLVASGSNFIIWVILKRLGAELL